MRRPMPGFSVRASASVLALLALALSACGSQTPVRQKPTATVLPTPTPVVLQGHITEMRVDAFPDVIATSPADGSVWFTGEHGVWQIGTSGTPTNQCCAHDPVLHNDQYSWLAIEPDGSVWIAANNFSLTAARIVLLQGGTTSGSFAIQPGTRLRLGPMVADRDSTLGDTLWFVEEGTGGPAKVGHMDATGKILAEYQIPVSFVSDMVAGPDGALWFTGLTYPDSFIMRMTPDGHFTRFPVPTTKSNPFGIIIGPDGALWFTETSGNKIGRITTDGHITEYPLPTQDAGPTYITVGPDGALWFTTRNLVVTAGRITADTSRIGRITLQGAVTDFAVPTAMSEAGQITATATTIWFTESRADQIGRLT